MTTSTEKSSEARQTPEEPIRSTQRRGEEGVFGYRTRRLAGFSYIDSLAEWRTRAVIEKAKGK